jgi:hypothetical protein
MVDRNDQSIKKSIPHMLIGTASAVVTIIFMFYGLMTLSATWLTIYALCGVGFYINITSGDLVTN